MGCNKCMQNRAWIFFFYQCFSDGMQLSVNAAYAIEKFFLTSNSMSHESSIPIGV